MKKIGLSFQITNLSVLEIFYWWNINVLSLHKITNTKLD